MSCPKWENDIALYAGGDLPARRLAHTVAHLEGCAGCRALADDLRIGQTLLGELRDEATEDAMAARVRRRVMARLAVEQARPARRYWNWALVAAALVAAILALPWRAEKKVPSLRVAVAPRIEAAPAAIVNLARPAVRRRRHSARVRHAAPPESSEPLLVQLVTDDPNIVIYWLVDARPQGD